MACGRAYHSGQACSEPSAPFKSKWFLAHNAKLSEGYCAAVEFFSLDMKRDFEAYIA